jgi:manganese/zinc/iron transport system permease protein
MNYTLLLVLHGSILLGMISGILGTFALLRQQSLLGDAISHAALPGIVTMFLLTYSKNPWILLCGGALAGLIGVVSMHYICATTRLKKDAILGIILSVFFGLGLVLMTIAQKIPVCSQAILNKFLFGNVATLLPEDILIITLLASFICAIVCIVWKECIVYVFDSVFTHTLGFATKKIETVLTLLLIIVIVLGLQTVGVVLMSTMLIAPAAAARQWVIKVSHMTLLAGFFGGISALVGVLASSFFVHIPTGPAIVVVASSIVIISLLCAPKRGVA